MPTKKPGLFDVTGKEPPKPKKPTLKQYLKETTHVTFPVFSLVEIVWFPGNWDNFSIECGLFRVSVGASHPLYKPLDESIVSIATKSDTGILLCLEDTDGTIGFCESTVYGAWKAIGNAGYRFEPTEGAN